MVAMIAVVGTVLVGCNDKKEAPAEAVEQTTEVVEETAAPAEAPVAIEVAGLYADAGYADREKGADWVNVIVTAEGEDALAIQVRSREDIKKATCTADALAKKVGDNVYQAEMQGKKVNFTFDAQGITIATVDKADEGVLNYFCSGGATLAGTYAKVVE